MDAFRLDGEIALITGGGTGLGLAMSKCLAEAGAQVVIVGRREGPLQEAVQAIGHGTQYEVFDVSRFEEVPGLIKRISDRFGLISLLINNAGIHLKKPAVEVTDEEFTTMMNIHVTGSFVLTRAAAPAMIERKHGCILFIASMASLFGLPKTVAYSAAKSAQLGLVRTLATELSPHNVRVNAIAPGFITSDMTRKALDSDPERKRRVFERTPMNRMGEAEDISYAAVYLCSPAAKYVTGVTLPVDGGTSIGF